MENDPNLLWIDDTEQRKSTESNPENKEENNNNEAYKNINEKTNKAQEDLKINNLWSEITLEDVLKQLSTAKTIEQNVKTFAKWTDKYWLEAILSLVPVLWDFWPAILSTCFLFYEWHKAWLTTKDMLKIFWYQTADFLLWSIPFAWNVVDFFFKSNKYSTKIFSKHVEQLKKLAIIKWATQEDIDHLSMEETEIINKFEEFLRNRKQKAQKKQNKNNY